MVNDASSHARSHAQTGVYPAEVIAREVQRACGFQVVQLPGVAKSQACKPDLYYRFIIGEGERRAGACCP